MASATAFNRNSFYCYILLIAVLLFQLRYLPPGWEHELLAAHTRMVFFIVAALLVRGAIPAQPLPGKLALLCVVFFALALVSVVNAVEPGAAFARWYNYFSCWLLACGIFLALLAGLVSRQGIYAAVILACLVIVVAEARDIAQEWQMYREMNKNRLWNPLYFNQLRNFAHVPFAGLVLSAWLLCESPGQWRFALGTCLTLVFMTVLLWTGGRTPLMMLPLCLLCCLVVLPRKLCGRVALVWTASALVGFGLLHGSDNDFMLQNAVERFGQDVTRLGNLVQPGESGEEKAQTAQRDLQHLGSGRMTHWRNAYLLWQQHPLLGNGADAFLVDTNFVTTHPHNWILRTLLEFGAVGLVLVVVILVALLWPALRIIRGNPAENTELAVATVLLVAWLGYAALSGNLYFSWSLSLFSVLAGVLVGARFEPTRVAAEPVQYAAPAAAAAARA